MTGITLGRSLDMRLGFTCRLDTVVTSRTGARRYRRMIKLHHLPLGGVVTAIALTGGCNMRGMFTRCGCAVVTTRTGANNRGVIHLDHLLPTKGGVTQRTGAAGSDM